MGSVLSLEVNVTLIFTDRHAVPLGCKVCNFTVCGLISVGIYGTKSTPSNRAVMELVSAVLPWPSVDHPGDIFSKHLLSSANRHADKCVV